MNWKNIILNKNETQNKTPTQQIFLRGLFLNRSRSQSVSNGLLLKNTTSNNNQTTQETNCTTGHMFADSDLPHRAATEVNTAETSKPCTEVKEE